MSSPNHIFARSVPLVAIIASAFLAGCSDSPMQPASQLRASATGSSVQSVALAGVDVRGEYNLNGSSTMYVRFQDAASGFIAGHGAFNSEPYTYTVNGTVSGSSATFRINRSDSYFADFTGTVSADGVITGTWRDKNNVTGAFTAVPQDRDADGIGRDNCPELPNPDQSNGDGDLDGDACDLDLNNDGVPERHWDLRADYGLEIRLGGTLNEHSLSIRSHDVHTGAVAGIGKAVASPFYTWTVSGNAMETSLSLRIVYDGAGYSIDLSGVILNDGSLSGTWRDSNGMIGIFRTRSGHGFLSTPDADGDGVPDSIDNAPNDPNPRQEDFDGDGVGDVADVCPSDSENDIDDDGVCGDIDNAPHSPNPDQADTDSDRIADVLDACPLDSHNDEDGDDVCGDVDNAPVVYNPRQEDGDRDGVGDVADNCPAVINSDQRDEDRDGVGDACEQRNTPPVITALTGPTGPIQLVSGSAIARIVVSFTDPDQGDTHQTTIQCGNGTFAVLNGTSAVPYDCRYAQPDVYTVTATVTDGSGVDTETFEYVVVYDPSAGFVTGGGWITYNGTACPVLCGNNAGRADFGFVSKYVKGATVPNGSTRFEFHAGTLQFASTSYEWLVVAGAKGQFKGRGSINGSGDYGFLLTAVDGSMDKFRIKIWDRAAGEENPAFDTGAEIQLDKITGGGSIVIHSK